MAQIKISFGFFCSGVFWVLAENPNPDGKSEAQNPEPDQEFENFPISSGNDDDIDDRKFKVHLMTKNSR